MFFPQLTRRAVEQYYNSNQRFYADYKRNKSKIEEDCKNRCVYCDILTAEMGGEGMQLDHFRPQAHFPDLKNDPLNLVLSCPKCNVLKSDDWPAGRDVNSTFLRGLGYIDYFSHTVSDYLSVGNDGRIVSLKAPSDYMIKKMQLNRLSRVYVRRSRVISKSKDRLSKVITEELERLHKQMIEKKLDPASATKRLGDILNLKQKLDSL